MAEMITERVVSVFEPDVSIRVVETKEITQETALKEQTTDLEIRAGALPVTNDAEYESAAEFGKALKAKANEVTTFFKPMKDAAHKAHKEICEREKMMLAPLSAAERLVKLSMGRYVDEVEQKRIMAEEAARKAAEEAANKKLQEAIYHEENGNKEEAAIAVEEAELIDNVASTMTVAKAAPKIGGVTTRKDWEIESIHGSTVPINFAGMELRPVDNAAIMRLIRASKGTIAIPGVKYKETTNMSFRR